MNVALRRALTVAEYLAWGAAQSERQRSELINGQIVAMPPEQVEHNRLKIRALKALERALGATTIEGEVFIDGVTVPIDEHTAYEPDALLRVGPPLAPHQLKIGDPVVVVEVLSPSTAHTDTSAKLIGYFRVPSVHHYLVVDPDARSVTHHARSAQGAIEARTLASGPLMLDPPGIAFDIADLFG
jgi:Uma2 family endonuclease